jgi:hypothetical protein
MRSSFKATLVLTTAVAIALTSLDLRPAAATPESGPAIVKQNAGAAEFSAARKRRRGRGVNPAIPLAAFGAIIGTIGSIAAAQQRRDYYERYYDGPYRGGYVYEQPYVAQVPVFNNRGYHRGYHGPPVQHRGYQGPPVHHRGHQGPPGYRGPYEPPGPARQNPGAPPPADRVPP